MLKNLPPRSFTHKGFHPEVSKRFFEYTMYVSCAWVMFSDLPMVGKLAACAIGLGSVYHIKTVERSPELVECRLDKD